MYIESKLSLLVHNGRRRGISKARYITRSTVCENDSSYQSQTGRGPSRSKSFVHNNIMIYFFGRSSHTKRISRAQGRPRAGRPCFYIDQNALVLRKKKTRLLCKTDFNVSLQ